MPYASHRVVGVMELDANRAIDGSQSTSTRRCVAARASAVAIRRIGFELAESKFTPPAACEPTLPVDSATLQRELEAELASLLSRTCSVQVS
jgi:hypothetical protein